MEAGRTATRLRGFVTGRPKSDALSNNLIATRLRDDSSQELLWLARPKRVTSRTLIGRRPKAFLTNEAKINI